MNAMLEIKLCHRMAPDGCQLSAADAAGECLKLWPLVEQRFQKSAPLLECNSNAAATRRMLLERFSFPELEERGRLLARGLYIFFEGVQATRENAFYVGVANDVPRRLVNHLSGTSHHTSSLLYLLMHRHLPPAALLSEELDASGQQKKKKRAVLFGEHGETRKEIRAHLLAACRVVLFPVPDIVTLHFLEAFAALELKTGPWNSFRPH